MIVTNATQPIDYDKAMDLVSRIEDPQIRLLFAIGFCTAYRISTILQLKFGDFFDSDGNIVKTLERFESKQGLKRKTQVNNVVKQCFIKWHRKMIQKAYYSNDMYLFSDANNLRRTDPIHYRTANRWIAKTCEKYEVDVIKPSSHFLRKTFARRLYEIWGKNDHALKLVQAVLGHRDPYVTMRYIGLERDIAELGQDMLDVEDFKLAV